jgi:hypothetical protein
MLMAEILGCNNVLLLPLPTEELGKFAQTSIDDDHLQLLQ